MKDAWEEEHDGTLKHGQSRSTKDTLMLVGICSIMTEGPMTLNHSMCPSRLCEPENHQKNMPEASEGRSPTQGGLKDTQAEAEVKPR